VILVCSMQQGLCNDTSVWLSCPILCHSGFAAVGPTGSRYRLIAARHVCSRHGCLSLHIHSSTAVSSKCEHCHLYSNVWSWTETCYLWRAVWIVLTALSATHGDLNSAINRLKAEHWTLTDMLLLGHEQLSSAEQLWLDDRNVTFVWTQCRFMLIIRVTVFVSLFVLRC